MEIRAQLESCMTLDAESMLVNRPSSCPFRPYLLKMRDSFLKKEITVDRALEENAFEVFSTFNIRGRSFKIEPRSLWEQSVLDHVIYQFSRMEQDLYINPCPLLQLAYLGDFGKGSSAGVCSDRQNYVERLVGQPLTFTSRQLIVPYKIYCSHSGWSSCERERQLNHGMRHQPHGNATFVPKDTSKYRMVVTQPSLDMLFQRGFGEFIRQKMRNWWNLDIEKQEKIQRRMAYIGSCDGSLATIDSTSASDSIYLQPLREAGVISDFLNEVISCFRPKWIKYEKKIIALSMIGTQGCGYTFDLMTFLLGCIIEGVYAVMGIDFKNGVTFGVYGDDVICVSAAYNNVITAMKMFGFIPNKDKSYNHGTFRESCGADFNQGVNVRPFYPNDVTSTAGLIVTYNKLIEHMCLHYHQGIYFWRSLALLRKELRRRGVPKVPIYESFDAGMHSLMTVGHKYHRLFPVVNTKPGNWVHPDAKVQLCIRGNMSGNYIKYRSDTITKYVIQTSVVVLTPHYPSWHGYRNGKHEDIVRIHSRVSAFLD